MGVKFPKGFPFHNTPGFGGDDDEDDFDVRVEIGDGSSSVSQSIRHNTGNVSAIVSKGNVHVSDDNYSFDLSDDDDDDFGLDDDD